MPAFHPDILSPMRELIIDLSKRIRTHGKPDLSTQEMMESFWPAELHDAATSARKHFRAEWTSVLHLRMPTKSPARVLNLHLMDPDAPAIPLEALPFSKASPEVQAKLKEWINHEVSTARNYGLTLRVLEELNVRCATPGQVRFYWPAVIQLLDHVKDGPFAGKSRALAAKLRISNPPARLPSLPVGLRDVLHETTGYVTGGLLTEETDKVPGSVHAWIFMQDMASFDKPDLTHIDCV